LYKNWWKQGRKETQSIFNKYCANYEAELKDTNEERKNEILMKIQCLGIDALPYMVKKIEEGKEYLIPVFIELTSVEDSEKNLKGTASKKDCLKWWKKNKKEWQLPGIYGLIKISGDNSFGLVNNFTESDLILCINKYYDVENLKISKMPVKIIVLDSLKNIINHEIFYADKKGLIKRKLKLPDRSGDYLVKCFICSSDKVINLPDTIYFNITAYSMLLDIENDLKECMEGREVTISLRLDYKLLEEYPGALLKLNYNVSDKTTFYFIADWTFDEREDFSIISPAIEENNKDHYNNITVCSELIEGPLDSLFSFSHEQVKELSKIKRAEESGINYEDRSNTELYDILKKSSNIVDLNKVTKELGDRYIRGKLVPNKKENKLIYKSVNKFIDFQDSVNPQTREGGRYLIDRLWYLAIPALLENLPNKKISKFEISAKCLLLMKNEEVIQKIIEIAEKERNKVIKKQLIFILNQVAQVRTTIVPDRKSIDEAESIALFDKVVKPALERLEKKE